MLEKYPGKVRLLFKNFPLRNHRMAQPAAIAALAAGRQDRYWDYHDSLYENFRDISEEMLVATARDLGLDMERFEKDRKDPGIVSLINRDIQEANRIGVRGTPTIFINGRSIAQRSLEAFSAAIETELKTLDPG